jgi:uncharacterized protein (TIGR03118 family)
VRHTPISAEPANPFTIDRRASAARAKTAITRLLALYFAAIGFCCTASAQTAGTYQEANIISDGSVAAPVTDPAFINPWGVSSTKAFWINTNTTGLSYVANVAGVINFKVTIPPAGAGTGTPTGTVTTGAAAGFLLPNGIKATFLFSSLDGTISGWNSALGTGGSVAKITVNNSAANAVYTDTALLTNANGTYILAANFGQGADIEVYDNTFKAAKLSGSFTDANLPTGYAPYGVHVIGTQVFVTYQLRATTPPFSPSIGPGNGLVDVFDTSGNFVARAVTGGNLNAPWGVAIAPAGFGIYGGDLLVGNFGDGLINVYDSKSYAYLGQVIDGTGKPMSFPSLWEIFFGTGTTGIGDPNTLYFAAGLANEAHGLFGAISNATPSSGTPTFGLSASSSAITVAAGSAAQATISVAPTNGFSGVVTLKCSGLPPDSTFGFTSNELSVPSTASATTTITIQTGNQMGLVRPGRVRGSATKFAAVFLLPFGAIFVSRRRRALYKTHLRLLGLFVILLTFAGFVAGCSSSGGTPSGTSKVTITATSGSTTQSTVVALTVQ